MDQTRRETIEFTRTKRGYPALPVRERGGRTPARVGRLGHAVKLVKLFLTYPPGQLDRPGGFFNNHKK